MGDIVQRADVKTLLRITTAEYDDELDLTIKLVENRFQGEIGQLLAERTYSNEKYTGNGTRWLKLRHWPLTVLTSVAIEDESAIDTTDDTVIRFQKNVPDWAVEEKGLLELVGGRVWTRSVSQPINVTVTYDAGYGSGGLIEIYMPDVHALVLDSCAQMFQDYDRRRRGVASQSHMSGTIAYFEEGNRNTEWYRRNWRPVVQKHRRNIGSTAIHTPGSIGEAVPQRWL